MDLKTNCSNECHEHFYFTWFQLSTLIHLQFDSSSVLGVEEYINEASLSG
jgi:hypothetical protein